MLFIAASAIGVGKSGVARLSLKTYVGLALPLLLGQALLNLLFQADLTLLGRFASEAALSSGAPLARADALVGAYRATQLFSFLPYQILIAITFILFPMLAAAAQTKDAEAIARYVRTGLRLSLIIAGAMVSVTLMASRRACSICCSAPDAALLGTRALSLLSRGFGALRSLATKFLTTVLNSPGRERESMWVTAFAVVVVAALCFTRAHGAALSEQLLWLTAQATSTGLLAATLIAALSWSIAPPVRLVSPFTRAAHRRRARRIGADGALALSAGQVAHAGGSRGHAVHLFRAAGVDARARPRRPRRRAQGRAPLVAVAGRDRFADEQIFERFVARHDLFDGQICPERALQQVVQLVGAFDLHDQHATHLFGRLALVGQRCGQRRIIARKESFGGAVRRAAKALRQMRPLHHHLAFA